MKKRRSFAGVLINILLGVLAALVVVAVGGYMAFKFYFLPKYTQKLEQSGHENIAAVVEKNSDLGSLAVLGSALADRDVMSFLAGIDRNSAKSMLEVISEMEQEYNAEIDAENNAEVVPELEQNADNATWKVSDRIPSAVKNTVPQQPVIEPAPEPTAEPVPSQPEAAPKTAYERIAAAATAEEMAEGLRIIAKIDVGYVTSLTADGLTPDEKIELKQYIHSRLTSAEISKAMGLYNKYSKYL